jgi:hypothetical protein
MKIVGEMLEKGLMQVTVILAFGWYKHTIELAVKLGQAQKVPHRNLT